VRAHLPLLGILDFPFISHDFKPLKAASLPSIGQDAYALNSSGSKILSRRTVAEKFLFFILLLFQQYQRAALRSQAEQIMIATFQ
jgi:hypothetical protein